MILSRAIKPCVQHMSDHKNEILKDKYQNFETNTRLNFEQDRARKCQR